MDDRGMVEILLELENSDDFIEKKENEVDGWFGGYDECLKKKKTELPKTARLAEQQRREEQADDSFEEAMLNRRAAKEKYFDYISKENSKASLYRIKRNAVASHGARVRNPLAAVEKEEEPSDLPNTKTGQGASIFRQNNLRSSLLAQELDKAQFSSRAHNPKHQTPHYSHVTFKAEELIQLAEPKQPLAVPQALPPARVVQLRQPPLSLVPNMVQEFTQQLSQREYRKSQDLRKNRGASFNSRASGQEKDEKQQDGREKKEEPLIRTRMFPLASLEFGPMSAALSNPPGLATTGREGSSRRSNLLLAPQPAELPKKERSEHHPQENSSRARDLSVGKKSHSEGFAQVTCR